MKTQYAKKYSVVADLYDEYVDYKEDICFWVKEAQKDKEVLELTAGTGRVTLPLARAGVKVTAVDASRDMLKVLRDKARAEGLSVTVRRADIRKFDLHRRFPLVIIPFNSIAEIVDGQDRKAVLAGAKRHLKRSGRLILTAHNFHFSRASLVSKIPRKEHLDPRTGRKVIFWGDSRVDPSTHTGVSHQHYQQYDASGKRLGARLFENRYHVFDREELERLIESAGFRVAHVYGDYSYSPLEAASPFMIYELVGRAQ